MFNVTAIKIRIYETVNSNHANKKIKCSSHGNVLKLIKFNTL